MLRAMVDGHTDTLGYAGFTVIEPPIKVTGTLEIGNCGRLLVLIDAAAPDPHGDTADATLDLLGQGGIPSIGLSENGVLTHIRLEHAWVEAWVDFEPSRGVKNRRGDHWIPMDASFKQYDFSEGMDLQQNVPFDAQELANEINANATVNEAEGWVQNLPQAAIEAQLQDFQQQLETYIDIQNPEATVGEVLGLKEVTIIPAGPLSAG